MHDLGTGAKLGPYQLLTLLGRGNSASVWIARTGSGDQGPRLLALKVINEEPAEDPGFCQAFLAQGKLSQQLKHENCVRVLDVGEDHGIFYEAQEWVEGDSLAALIRETSRRGAVPPEIAVFIISAAAAGLHAMHQLQGFSDQPWGGVHGDLSPRNILLGSDGTTKVSDFGLAGALSRVIERPGKAAYYSPEQARSQPLDARTDVFALGVNLFELTLGQRLFHVKDNEEQTLEKVRACEVPKPSSLSATYPRVLEGIVLKALARDRDERFGSAAELSDALRKYLVDARIVVTDSSLAALLQRVFTVRTRRLREMLRTALTSLDGFVDPALVPERRSSISALSNPSIPLPSNVRASKPSIDPGDDSLTPPVSKSTAASPPPTSTAPGSSAPGSSAPGSSAPGSSATQSEPGREPVPSSQTTSGGEPVSSMAPPVSSAAPSPPVSQPLPSFAPGDDSARISQPVVGGAVISTAEIGVSDKRKWYFLSAAVAAAAIVAIIAVSLLKGPPPPEASPAPPAADTAAKASAGPPTSPTPAAKPAASPPAEDGEHVSIDQLPTIPEKKKRVRWKPPAPKNKTQKPEAKEADSTVKLEEDTGETPEEEESEEPATKAAPSFAEVLETEYGSGPPPKKTTRAPEPPAEEEEGAEAEPAPSKGETDDQEGDDSEGDNSSTDEPGF